MALISANVYGPVAAGSATTLVPLVPVVPELPVELRPPELPVELAAATTLLPVVLPLLLDVAGPMSPPVEVGRALPLAPDDAPVLPSPVEAVNPALAAVDPPVDVAPDVPLLAVVALRLTDEVPAVPLADVAALTVSEVDAPDV